MLILAGKILIDQKYPPIDFDNLLIVLSLGSLETIDIQ